ncbi:PREDICTED: uncharacterized protein LOC104787551 [Camelina sativa]|uniref:Uncharacterized protein LOC104787551 n=1 Tax=Camelina sativa TaxID=90675 RepID=A0ABM1RRD0_CAMSA|nr:PREDICTED: uncharacterized protein LOC104787551 [Camelina sativa]
MVVARFSDFGISLPQGFIWLRDLDITDAEILGNEDSKIPIDGLAWATAVPDGESVETEEDPMDTSVHVDNPSLADPGVDKVRKSKPSLALKEIASKKINVYLHNTQGNVLHLTLMIWLVRGLTRRTRNWRREQLVGQSHLNHILINEDFKLELQEAWE